MKPPFTRSLASALTGVALLAGWGLFLRPTALGGSTTYIVVSGRSMEPQLHTGDLAVVRRRSHYRVGDVIVYQVDGGKVIHRIIGGTAQDGFITQGINRDSPDIWRPQPSQIYGTMWTHVGGVGQWAARLAAPVPFAILCGGLVAVSLFSPKPSGRRVRVKAGAKNPLTAKPVTSKGPLC